MHYFKIAQEIPGKGLAWTWYECDAAETVLRQLTYIPETGALDRVPDPIVKRLIRPDLLQEAAEEDFLALWNR